jgi:apolipoprotein D and lipocalin family protein
MWPTAIALAASFLQMGVAAADPERPLPVAPSVELARYVGKWYEIARLPNRFQGQCASDVTATYALLPDGQLQVINACRTGNGAVVRVEGRARPADASGPNTKLEVRFVPAWLGWLPFVWGDYWIVDLAPDYSYSVVGTPSREYLWILARSPDMDAATYDQLTQRAAAQGFEVGRLIRTRHSAAAGN